MAYAFEEKQYEMAGNGELQTDPPELFTPGQVLEKVLGFDLAGTTSNNNPVWSILGQGAPAGIQLSPNLWPFGARPTPEQLPSFAVSLVLQYKRSEYVDWTRARQYAHWREPYYRYLVSPIQHSTLLQLEAAVGVAAMVRYAAPVFHLYTELEGHQLRRQVLTHSNFVSPATIGPAHTVWSFISGGVSGWPNPEGEELTAESWEQVRRNVQAEMHPVPLEKHLAELASAVIRVQLSRDVPLPPVLRIGDRVVGEARVIQSVVNACHFAHAVSLTGGSWWIALTSQGVP